MRHYVTLKPPKALGEAQNPQASEIYHIHNETRNHPFKLHAILSLL